MMIRNVRFKRRLLLLIGLLSVLLLLAGQFGRAQDAQDQDTASQHLQSRDTEVWLLPIVGGIGPATADFVDTNLEKAQAEGLQRGLLGREPHVKGVESSQNRMAESRLWSLARPLTNVNFLYCR